MVVGPGIEVKAVEGNSLGADGDLGEMRPHGGIEAVAVHAEIARCIAQADEARENAHRSSPSGDASRGFVRVARALISAKRLAMAGSAWVGGSPGALASARSTAARVLSRRDRASATGSPASGVNDPASARRTSPRR